MDTALHGELARALARHERRRRSGVGVVSCVLGEPDAIVALRPDAVVAHGPAGLEEAWPRWMARARANAREPAIEAIAVATGRSSQEVRALIAEPTWERDALIERAAATLGSTRDRGVVEAFASDRERGRTLDVDAAVALASLRAALPDLVLVGPAIAEVRRALYAVERCPALPIVLCVGRGALDEMLRELPAGARDRLRLGLTMDDAAIVDRAATHSPARGSQGVMRAARDALAAGDSDRARSLAERLLFEALESEAQTRGLFALNHRIAGLRFGQRDVEIDLAAPSIALAVEVDGIFHFLDAEAYRRDRRKDLLLQHHGFLVVRVLAEDVVERIDEVLDTVLAAVRHARTRKGTTG